MDTPDTFYAAGGIRLWRPQPTFPLSAFDPFNVAMNFLGIMPLADRLITYNFLDIAWALRVEMVFYIVMTACIAFAGRRGFAMTTFLASIVLFPLFVLALNWRGIATFSFLPYFAFGSALYFATNGRVGGWVAIGLSTPAMIWECVFHPATNPAPNALPPSTMGNLILLLALLAVMSLLVSAKIGRLRTLDRALGDMTYPLYLYHEVVLILALTFTTGYSYSILILSMIASLAFAAAMTAAIDPTISRFRDRVRGVRLATT